MKRLVILLTLLHLSTVGFSQFLQAAGGSNSVLREVQYKSVEGTPYLYEDFKNGGIRDKKGMLSENMLIRYDGYRDEVQFLKDGKTLVVEPSLASEFYFLVLNPETKLVENMVFKNGFTIDGFTNLSYFQVVYDGKVKYLRKIKVNYLEENVNNYGTNEVKKRFQRSDSEFIIRNGQAIPVAKARKDFISKYGNQALVKAFIKENKLNIKSDTDLGKVLRRFDDL
jgi:hypothetical protein